MTELATITGTRDDVVAEALTWEGTKYHHHARIKGVGVDCAQILVGVYAACGLVPELDLGNYRRDWHKHRAEELYRDQLLQYMRMLPEGEAPLRGDIALFRFDLTLSHAGILLDDAADYVLHAYILQGVVRTRICEEPLAGREVVYFSPWGT